MEIINTEDGFDKAASRVLEYVRFVTLFAQDTPDFCSKYKEKHGISYDEAVTEEMLDTFAAGLSGIRDESDISYDVYHLLFKEYQEKSGNKADGEGYKEDLASRQAKVALSDDFLQDQMNGHHLLALQNHVLPRGDTDRFAILKNILSGYESLLKIMTQQCSVEESSHAEQYFNDLLKAVKESKSSLVINKLSETKRIPVEGGEKRGKSKRKRQAVQSAQSENPEENPEEEWRLLSSPCTYDLTGRELRDLPVYERDREIRLLTAALMNKKAPFAYLVSESGSGKLAIVEELGRRIVAGDVSGPLRDAEILNFDYTDYPLAQYDKNAAAEQFLRRARIRNDSRGEDPCRPTIVSMNSSFFMHNFPTILKSCVKTLRSPNGHIVDPLPLIVRFTPEHYQECQKNNLLMPLRKIELSPLPEETVRKALADVSAAGSMEYLIQCPQETLDEIVHISQRNPGIAQPGWAISIYEQARSLAKADGLSTIDTAHVHQVIRQHAKNPVGLKTNASQGQWRLNIREELGKSIIGQEEAIDKVASVFEGSLLKSHDKPLGAFLFRGPTGVGKTELACQIAHLYRTGTVGPSGAKPPNLIRVDLSEYSERHTTSRILGAPVGYQGYDPTSSPLLEAAEYPECVLLLDEFEKGHEEVRLAFMNLLDTGEITLRNGTKLDFRKAVVIATTNLGESEASATATRSSIGFTLPSTDEKEKDANQVRQLTLQAWPPEFVNRFSDIVQFNYIDEQSAAKVLQLKIESVSRRLQENYPDLQLSLELGEDIPRQLLQDCLQDCKGKFNGRAVERSVDRGLGRPLGRWLLKHMEECKKRPAGSVLRIDSLNENLNPQFIEPDSHSGPSLSPA